jgi:Ser/Thr protein kinase RdoA (MazF antagonist)
MKFLRANAPTLPLLHVQQIAREHFGLRGDAKALYSERDQNTLFREADGRAWMPRMGAPAFVLSAVRGCPQSRCP